MNILLLAVVLFAQDDAKRAKDVLEAASAVLKDAPALSFETRVDGLGVETQAYRVALKRPGLARVETGKPGENLILADGRDCWTYSKQTGQYWKYRTTEDGLHLSGAALVAELYFNTWASLLEEAADVAVKRVEEAGETLDVVSWKTEEESVALFVDSKRRVRKAEIGAIGSNPPAGLRVTYSALDVAPKLADDAFIFKAPAGATEIRDESLQVGASAPGFSAEDVDGKIVTLSDYKGTVVVVCFWTSG